MNPVLFKQVKILDPNSSFHKSVCDVLIQDGTITKINKSIKASPEVIQLHNYGSILSPGWVDVGTCSGEPGNEHRETWKSLAAAAQKGGYTTLLTFPNNQPFTHSKTEVQSIVNHTSRLQVNIFPIGALSKDGLAKEMADYLQMYDAGAVAFSDGSISMQHQGMMLRALEYSKLIPKGLVINIPEDAMIAGTGQMHEGQISTFLGLKGIPEIAEKIMLDRDLSLQEYTGSRLMLHKISTSYSTDKIKRAKKQSDHIFSTVSIFNLLFEDKSLVDFEVNYKFKPPLRDGTTLKSLVKGVLDRSIDIIVSDHTPWDTEKKDLEFQQSAFGSINLETAYASLRTFGDKVLTDEIWVECVAIRPRQIFNLPSTSIQINEKADLCWFHPETEWKYTSENIHSKSKNTPYPGVTFKGKALGIYCKNNFYDNR